MSFDKTTQPHGRGWLPRENTSEIHRNNTFDVKLKPGLLKLINPTSPKYVTSINDSYNLENEDFCSEEKHLTLLVVIPSSTKYFKRRNAIRETWGNSSFYLNNGTVKVLFVLGLTKDLKDQQQIEAEFWHNKDILQGSFMDSYKNLSYKSVLCFKWLTERCKNAKYFLKTDDDVVINIFHIFETNIFEMSVDQYHVHCERLDKSEVIRRINEKPYVEPHQLRGLEYHMPYCHGQYVLFLNNIVPSLYKSAVTTPFFWIDDVFNYGIVMNNIPKLKYKQVRPTEHVTYSKMNRSLCLKQRSHLCRHLYIVADNDKQIKEIWSIIYKQYRIK